MKKTNKLCQIIIISLLPLALIGCKELDRVYEKVKPVLDQAKQTASDNSITTEQMIAAIKQALNQGVADSIHLLGSLEGFNLGNRYRIELPDKLDKPAKLLRKLGQGRKVDEFENRLNLAAKQAVKQSTPIFTQAIKGMSVKDALGIMQGNDHAATAYFRNKTENPLRNTFRPIIKNATDQTGLTSTYKSFNKSMTKLSSSLSSYTVDIDEYVLDHAMDALFDRIAVEEKLIREQPVKRTTDLMKTVYGYFEK